VLIDIDRFARLNQRFGARAGDLSIAALSKLFQELITKDGSADCIARVDGEAFLVLMADAGPREALTAAERLRQTVEAMTFEHQGDEFELTVSCGVIEVGREELVPDLLRRVREALRYAKKAGRNRCALDEGRGPTTLEPPQFPVKGRLVRLGEQ
jgi:diguanylate cyclase (GGDEF)-like protein